MGWPERRRHVRAGMASLVAGALAAGSLATVSSVVTATPAVADPCVTGGTPSGQPYTVPATGVSAVQVTVRGQAGQSWFWNGNPSADDATILNFETPGGLGSEMTVIIPVTPGQVLQAGTLAGAPGGVIPANTPDVADGASGGKGGDAQYVNLVGAGGCQTPVVVAAGGGGAGGGVGGCGIGTGGGGGGNADAGTGATRGGDAEDNSACDGGGGGAATATAGGSGGAHGHSTNACYDGNDGDAGALESGGGGAWGHGGSQICSSGFGAGGGGGGYYFGGGGGSGFDTNPSGGGGGGSSYVMPGVILFSQGPSAPGLWTTTSTYTTDAATAAGGGAIIDPPVIIPAYDTSTTLGSSLNPSVQGDDVTLTADVSTVNPDFQVGGGTVTFRDFSNSGAILGSPVPVVLNADGTATASYTTSTLPPGTHSIRASYGGYAAATYGDRSSSSTHVSQSVIPTQTISFTSTAPADATAYGPTYAVSATATSGLPVSFSIDPAAATVCSVTGTTVSFIGAGTCVVNGDQAGDAGHAPAATAHQDITVAAGASQTIAFTSTPPAIVHVNDSSVVTARGGASGNPVVFSIPPGNACSIQGGNTVKCSVGGTWTIHADQAGGNGYAPAPQAHQQITIQPGPQNVIFDTTPPADPHIGDAYLVKAHATSSARVALTLDGTSVGCTLSTPAISEGPGYFITSATVTFTGHGTCVVDGNQ